MTEYRKCKHLEVTIKDMSRGALFYIYCKKKDYHPGARDCTKCIYKGENK